MVEGKQIDEKSFQAFGMTVRSSGEDGIILVSKKLVFPIFTTVSRMNKITLSRSMVWISTLNMQAKTCFPVTKKPKLKEDEG